MNRKLFVLVFSLFTLSASSLVSAASLTSCQEAMAKFKGLGNVSEMMAEAYGYAVLPTIGKAGMGIGGAGGKGGQPGSPGKGATTIRGTRGGDVQIEVVEVEE